MVMTYRLVQNQYASGLVQNEVVMDELFGLAEVHLGYEQVRRAYASQKLQIWSIIDCLKIAQGLFVKTISLSTTFFR